MCEDDLEKDNCVGHYNKELLDPIEPVLINLLRAIVIISFILAIVAYKKRWLAEHFCNLECATRIIAIMIPNAAGYYYRNVIMHMIVFGVTFIMLFCGSGSEIIVLTLTLFFHLTVGAEVNYGDSEFETSTIMLIMI